MTTQMVEEDNRYGHTTRFFRRLLKELNDNALHWESDVFSPSEASTFFDFVITQITIMPPTTRAYWMREFPALAARVRKKLSENFGSK